MGTVSRMISIFTLLVLPASAASDLVIADFEGETYAPWTVTGDAFGLAPAKGALTGQMPVTGFLGKGLVNTFLNGDQSQGTLTSPEFIIERKFIRFLIGGGKNEKKLVLQLLADGEVVRTATGFNERPGGSEALQTMFWDVSDLTGKKVTLRIVDSTGGPWGHLNVDQIVQTDDQPQGLLSDGERKLTTTKRYLNFPIKNGATKRVVTLLVDGRPVVRNDMELADGDVDWWAPMDVGAWQGKELTLRVDKLPSGSKGLAAVEAADGLRDAANLYRDPLRGQFHFSPMRGWNNDPNGCVFYNGEYHLFFQHNPYGWAWGNMHWGHAVSKDLVHWEELGDPLLPDEMGMMYSGGAVVDWKNTSGFGKDGKPPLVTFYTAEGHESVQCMAYSNDGRQFTKYSGNPILKQITRGNRDPKVIWHEPTKQWVMVLYVELAGVHTIHFFTSPDLKQWTFASKADGFYECPEFFEAAVDANSSNKKWVLMAASSEYRIGSFDGKNFVPETPLLPGHRGKDFYAAQAFSDLPGDRRVIIGWWRTETKGMPFNQSMSLPLDLHLIQTTDGPRMTFVPVKELQSLRGKSHRIEVGTLQAGDKNPLADISADLIELRTEIETGEAEEVKFNVRGCPVSYNVKKQELTVDGHRAPAPLHEGKLDLLIYCDRIGVEVFASRGLCYMPVPINAKPEATGLSLEVRGGSIKLDSLEVHELKSAWQKK